MAKTKSDMREAVLAAARATVQARGYTALSFRELAKDVGIKSASVHYHFPTKGDLGVALARRYTEEGAAYLEEVLATAPDPHTCFDRYVAIFRAALANGNRMCLSGIMSAELDDLPEEVRREIERFPRMNIAWITRVLAAANPSASEEASSERAMAIYAAIAGAQLIARGRNDISVYDRAIKAYRVAGLIA
ncbi:TetR/AcrR family transcriptional regulator [Bradyrhizobium sp. 21]|uniref:TetR/AcrR family transcriptional regulator n=1 Tax=Bradyrhizobium sp. 21 TaxID=2782666 RepID=UPI001FFAA06A|nr:TetR/AcrR family transcriptional regulator [Bradyrhizobium sp. 21]MCK1388363.1 TetR/AcrR family transcriptional regulator [Bradyrhizobium sp. 21]